MIVEADDQELLDVGHREYARRWEGNATAYEAQGLYGRLVDHLAEHGQLRRIVDVGCGRGQGLAALRERFGDVAGLIIGIDENPDCLAAAAAHLQVSPPEIRLRRVPGLGRVYEVRPVSGPMPKLDPVVLVQADILRPDPQFEDWIAEMEPIDAVTLWFTGVHAAREFDALINELRVNDDGLHRMTNDLAALHLAEATLRPGGLYQVVGRGMTNYEPWLRDETEKNMNELAKRGSFEVISVELFRYTEPTSGPRIGVGATANPGLTGHPTYATSTILRRRH